MNTNVSASKKPKINRACDSCRKKKARCDAPQTFPNQCSNCKEGECTFNNPAPKKGVPQRYVNDLEAKLERYEATFGPLPPSAMSDGSPSSEGSHKRKFERSNRDNRDTESLTEKMSALFFKPDDEPVKDNEKERTRCFGKSSMKGIVKRITLHADFTALDLNTEMRSRFWNEEFITQTMRHSQAPYTHDDFGDQNLITGKFIDQISTVASLQDVQAMILMQLYVQNGLYPKSSWLISGNAMLLAQDIGLNIKWNDSKEDSYQQESRNRAMWALFILDTSNSAALGRFQLISYDDINLDLPSEIETDSKSRLSVRYMNQSIKLYKIVQDILKSIYWLKSNEKEGYKVSYNDIASLNSRLNGWYNKLPSELRDAKKSDDEEVFQMKCYLKIAYHTSQSYIYKSFLPDPSSAEFSTFRLTSLFICLNDSRTIISIFDDIQRAGTNSRGLCHSNCFLGWSTFSACLILVLCFCESRKNGDLNKNDLEYIQKGIQVLRKMEARDLIMGRAVDMILQLVIKAEVPLDHLFLKNQWNLSNNINPDQAHEYLFKSQLTFPYVDNHVQENHVSDVMDFNFDQFDAGLGGTEALNALMPSLDSREDDWSALLSTVFDGSSFNTVNNVA
ncbi:hypothetical protein E3P81_03628 [Wallemia ichthyophaga]|nr:hypothetical protein E3P97_03636 [Wallemia ichthyophaga]TIB28742.1 hypothetical protein E3P85_03502 [Wallemia ichthyophaga]TIB44215.1 hypothetical protein E3P82_03633 [Wallemia ichthyophaga]TIB46586.1 hypothetical protein E3P81_03628 [Wallemia ichthyophaga]TIB49219.1 hypothetical protein E3P80_03637 [Wallemia ichthyophaga]